MSTEKARVAKKAGFLANWKKLPIDIKIMDLATIAWVAIALFEVILLFIINIDMNVRTFPAVLTPLFMIVVTVSLRLKLEEKPEDSLRIFIAWASLFLGMFLVSLLILLLYPPLI